MKNGDICWTERGNKAVYAGEVEGQHFVRLLMVSDDCGDGEEWPSDRLTPVPRVFPSEPAEVLSPVLAETQKRLADLQTQVGKKNAELREAEKKIIEARKAAEKYPDIRTALDMIEGRITHVVVQKYGSPRIETLDEVLKDRMDRYDGGRLKLICLYGDPERRDWRIHDYSDGSGSSTRIIPARGLEDAQRIVRELFAAAVDKWRSSSRKDVHMVTKFRNCGVDLDWPDDVVEAAAAAERAARDSRIAEAQKKLAEAQAIPVMWGEPA